MFADCTVSVPEVPGLSFSSDSKTAFANSLATC